LLEARPEAGRRSGTGHRTGRYCRRTDNLPIRVPGATIRSQRVEAFSSLTLSMKLLKAQILQFDRLIMAWHRSNQASRRLDDVPGVGPALATALVAIVAEPITFRSGRNFSAWIGICRAATQDASGRASSKQAA
jgi:transposase